MSMLFAWLSTQVTQEAKATGLIVHRRKRVKYLSLFGIIRVESPYLWDKKTGRGARPVKDQLGTPRMAIALLQWNEPLRILELKNLLGKPPSVFKNTTAGLLTGLLCVERSKKQRNWHKNT